MLEPKVSNSHRQPPPHQGSSIKENFTARSYKIHIFFPLLYNNTNDLGIYYFMAVRGCSQKGFVWGWGVFERRILRISGFYYRASLSRTSLCTRPTKIRSQLTKKPKHQLQVTPPKAISLTSEVYDSARGKAIKKKPLLSFPPFSQSTQM